jgi:hypothetical protein
MNFKWKSILAAATLLVSVSANATLIDFTDRAKWEADGMPSSVMYGDLEVTVTAFDSNGDATNFNAFQNFDGQTSCNLPGVGMLACVSDGLGIGDDEITFGDNSMYLVERIRVTFSRAVNLSAVVFLDLFAQGSSSDNPTEVAQSVSNSGSNVWDGTAVDTAGFFIAEADNGRKAGQRLFTGVTKIDFFADTDGIDSPANTDFALAALVIDVPAPSALLLMIAAIAGLQIRRKLKK